MRIIFEPYYLQKIDDTPEKLWHKESQNYGTTSLDQAMVNHLNYPLKRPAKHTDPYAYNVISGSFDNHNL